MYVMFIQEVSLFQNHIFFRSIPRYMVALKESPTEVNYNIHRKSEIEHSNVCVCIYACEHVGCILYPAASNIIVWHPLISNTT